MSQWLNQVIAHAEVSDFLAPVRQAALQTLQQDGLPHRRVEAWRFTPIAALEKREWAGQADTTAAPVPQMDGLDSIDITYINGSLASDINALNLPDGVSVVAFSDADAEQQAAIAAVFGKVKPARHVFGLVNDVTTPQGLFIDVAPGAHMSPVIRVMNLMTGDADAHTRIVVRVGEGASAKVMEYADGETDSMSTAFAEYDIAKGAHLEHYRFALNTGKAKAVGGSHFKLGDEATLNSTLVGYGSELSRIDADIWHAGEHANAKMNAIYLLAEGEIFDLHTNIEHAVPNGTTEENARGIVGDGARAIFNGRIHIHRDAQKTLAELNNRNLLLSRRALINTKPELEIYADDVKCAHGATVAEIEEDALYYLLTRGIPRSKALVMLNFGFIQELVNQMPDRAVQAWLAPILSERFARMEVK